MSSPRMFGGYQETSRESVVTSVSDGQSGGEAAEQKGWKVEGVGENKWTEHNKGNRLWPDKHAVTVQQQLLFIVILYTLNLPTQLP